MALIFLSNSRVPERKTLCSDGSAHNYPTKHQKYWIFIPIFLFSHLELKQLLLVSCQMATSNVCPKSSSGWSVSALTCTLSVWQGQLAGNGTMELDSKTGAEYLKTYDTRKNTKSNHQVLRKGLFRGRQVLDRNIGNSRER